VPLLIVTLFIVYACARVLPDYYLLCLFTLTPKEIEKMFSLTSQNVKITLMIILAWEITTFWSSSRSKLFQGLN